MKVSVIITAYNHEKYISQAIDSVINQQFDGDLEIIIGDDCSTDSTVDIIREYKSKYPDNIFIIANKVNIGITKNLQQCLEKCTGEYIAICEGDDYWLTNTKIKKQMEYLEENPFLSMCFNKIYLYYEEQNKMIPHPSQEKLHFNSLLSTKDLIKDNVIGNFSCCMYRKKYIDSLDKEIFNFYTVDWMFNLAISQYGPIGFINEFMTVYRIHSSGAWSGMRDDEKLLSWVKCINIYDKYLKEKYHYDFNLLKKRIYKDLAKLYIKNKKFYKFLYSKFKSYY